METIHYWAIVYSVLGIILFEIIFKKSPVIRGIGIAALGGILALLTFFLIPNLTVKDLSPVQLFTLLGSAIFLIFYGFIRYANNFKLAVGIIVCLAIAVAILVSIFQTIYEIWEQS